MSASELECSICFEPYDTGLRTPMIVPCGGMHGLCTSCIAILKMDDSAEFKCPQCRETIENTSRINQNRGLMAALQALEKTKVVALEVAQPVDRRPDAVTETPVPPLPKPTGGVPCARCERTLPKSAFSGAQLKKKEARKCSECIFAAIGAPAPASLESEATSDEVAPLPAARAQRPEQIVARREPSLDEQCARALTLQLMCEAEIDRLTDDIATGTLTERVASQRINALMMRRMHAAFAGKRVRIHGLARRQDLNGRCGRVQGATNSDERFCITLEAATAGGETMVSVGTQNLELVAEEPPAEVERSEYKESLVVDLDVSMPEFRGDFGELERRCTECGAAPADPAQLKRCGQCKLTRYCSRECQRAGWVRGGHRTSCGCQSAWPSKEAIAQGTAPQVLAALNEFGTACPQLAAACLLRLGPLNMGPEAVRRHWATTFGQLGVSAIERAYAAHASFPGVVMLATGACMLLGELVGVAALLRGSLVKLVVESLAREFPPPPSGWPANALVATNAVTLLKNLFMEQDYAQVERVKDQLIAAGGVPALCKALRAFPDHKFTQLHGMQVLFFTTANRYDAKEQAAANDAPRLCVQALRAYGAGTSDAAQKMCHDGVGALRNITVGEDEPGVARKAQSLRAGAARAIYDALATHVSDDEVPLICISALLNHFHRTTASQLQSTLPQGIDGVLKLVVRALRASKDNDELHMFGMSVMNTFTIHCERERLTRVAVSFGAVETMVSMMSRFPQHETILDGCCLTLDGWLEELCPLEFTRSGEDEFMRFFEAGVLEPCLRALRTFRGLSSAVELFRRIMRTYSTYSSSETFVEETSKVSTKIGGVQQWLSDVMADVVGDP